MAWKTLTTEDRSNLANEFKESLAERLRYGLETYGESYTHDDPLLDLEEEAVDIFVYLHLAKRQRAEVRHLLMKIFMSLDNPADKHEVRHLVASAIRVIDGEPM